MPPAVLLPLLAGGAYLVGAIPFGYLVARARGVDIFAHGSGNIGATNVGRVLGRRYGFLVFALDFAKGALPTFLASRLDAPTDLDLLPGTLTVLAGVCAFLGHLFPVFLRFRGGKGVATGLGVVAVLAPVPALVALAVWAALLGATRIMSLASLAGGAALCAARLLLTPGPWGREEVVVTGFCLAGVALVFLRHAGNIRRLLRGTEHRL